MGNKEATEFISTLQNPEDDGKLRGLFNAYDKNGDGTLNKSEFIEFGLGRWKQH
jgi:Ca2+-binding EF-hand superfamily protein